MERFIKAMDRKLPQWACCTIYPIPFAPVMENYVVPSTERIVAEIRQLINE